jgi:hypothetical protein
MESFDDAIHPNMTIRESAFEDQIGDCLVSNAAIVTNCFTSVLAHILRGAPEMKDTVT